MYPVATIFNPTGQTNPLIVLWKLSATSQQLTLEQRVLGQQAQYQPADNSATGNPVIKTNVSNPGQLASVLLDQMVTTFGLTPYTTGGSPSQTYNVVCQMSPYFNPVGSLEDTTFMTKYAALTAVSSPDQTTAYVYFLQDNSTNPTALQLVQVTITGGLSTVNIMKSAAVTKDSLLASCWDPTAGSPAVFFQDQNNSCLSKIVGTVVTPFVPTTSEYVSGGSMTAVSGPGGPSGTNTLALYFIQASGNYLMRISSDTSWASTTTLDAVKPQAQTGIGSVYDPIKKTAHLYYVQSGLKTFSEYSNAL